MTADTNILTSLEVVLAELSPASSVGEGDPELRAALGGIEVVVDGGGSGVVVGSGDAAMAVVAIHDQTTLDIADLIVDYDLGYGVGGTLDLAALLEAFSTGDESSDRGVAASDGLVSAESDIPGAILTGIGGTIISILYTDANVSDA